MAHSYKVTVIDSLTEMAKIGKCWNDLLANSRSNTVFLTWEWLFSWAECFLGDDRQLFILAVYKEKTLIGLAPWCIHHMEFGLFTVRQIEFLGIHEAGSDYLDVFTKRGKEKETASCIYDFLFCQTPTHWDILMLQNIPADSLFLMHLLNKIEEAGKHVEIEPGSFSPIARLPRSWGEFMEGLSPNRREQFLRHLRVLKRNGDLEHTTVIPLEGTAAKTLQDFYRLSKKGREHLSSDFYQFLEKFISRCQGKDWVQFDFLKVNGQEVASFLHLHYLDTLSMYLMAVDRTFCPKISLGNSVIGLSIEKAIKDNIAVYDFLKGSERYKFHWANSGKRSLNLVVHQKRFWTALLVLRRSLKKILKMIVR